MCHFQRSKLNRFAAAIDDAAGDFESANGQWQADLAGIEWKRGSHSVQVQLTTKPPHRELKQVLALVYQPSPPKATSTLPTHSETSKEDFDFQAEVAPAAAGEAMRVTLTHQNGTKEPVVVSRSEIERTIQHRRASEVAAWIESAESHCRKRRGDA